MARRGEREFGGVCVAAHQRRERQYMNEAVRWRVIVDGLQGLMDASPYMEKGLYSSFAELYLYCEQRRRQVVQELNLAAEQGALFNVR